MPHLFSLDEPVVVLMLHPTSEFISWFRRHLPSNLLEAPPDNPWTRTASAWVLPQLQIFVDDDEVTEPYFESLECEKILDSLKPQLLADELKNSGVAQEHWPPELSSEQFDSWFDTAIELLTRKQLESLAEIRQLYKTDS